MFSMPMSFFIVDDGWAYNLSRSILAAGVSPEMAAEVEKDGINLYLWHHHRLLLILWLQGSAAPFLLYFFWFFTAVALRVAAVNHRHTPV